MTGAVSAILPGRTPGAERLHLQHGPIDLVIGADGERSKAFDAARERFATVLEELVAELPLLRSPVGARPRGRIAQRMFEAVRPHGDAGFITPMAAVAGSVAEEILEAMVSSANLVRAYVNNGGDIALHIDEGQSFRIAMADLANVSLGAIEIKASDPVRGIATSGRGGRSFSLGIADAVTVLADTSSKADAAATVIGNAVDIPGHPAVEREPASRLQPDSDLGERLVTVGVGPLMPDECDAALNAGSMMSRELVGRGQITAAALFLQGRAAAIGRTNCLAGVC